MTPGARSPSLEPTYNEEGVRTNSRIDRIIQRLERQRDVSACWRLGDTPVHLSAAKCQPDGVQQGQRASTGGALLLARSAVGFARIPAPQDLVAELLHRKASSSRFGDLSRLNKRSRKVPIPDREYPHVNFFGLLIGPRGNTQVSCTVLQTFRVH